MLERDHRSWKQLIPEANVKELDEAAVANIDSKLNSLNYSSMVLWCYTVVLGLQYLSLHEYHTNRYPNLSQAPNTGAVQYLPAYVLAFILEYLSRAHRVPGTVSCPGDAGMKINFLPLGSCQSRGKAGQVPV